MNFILLVPPAFYGSSRGGMYKIYPLGGLYLAESLIRKGYTVSIIDDDIEECFRHLRTIISDDTIAIGISSMSGTQLENALKIAGFIKDSFSNIPVIFGGAHATALPKQTLDCDLVDYIVYGEGEQSLPYLLEAIKSGSELKNIDGIGYKTKNKVIINDKIDYTPLSNRIYSLPYHLIDTGSYSRKLNIGVNKCFRVYSSRGCPFRCRFCSNSSILWPNTKIRYHTIEHVLKDISTLANQYGADCITFADEIFIFDEKRLIDICKAIITNGMNWIKYRASARIDTISRLHEDTFLLMKKAGFVGINIGIESGSEKVLSILGKNYKLDKIYSVDETLSRHGFYKTYNFMTCVPGENIEDVKDTVTLMLNLFESSKYCPFPIGVMAEYLPLPNTELFEEVVKYGWNPPDDIRGWTNLQNNPNDISEKIQRIWVDDQMWEYVQEANKQLLALDSLFTGPTADNNIIDKQILKVRDKLLT